MDSERDCIHCHARCGRQAPHQLPALMFDTNPRFCLLDLRNYFGSNYRELVHGDSRSRSVSWRESFDVSQSLPLHFIVEVYTELLFLLDGVSSYIYTLDSFLVLWVTREKFHTMWPKLSSCSFPFTSLVLHLHLQRLLCLPGELVLGMETTLGALSLQSWAQQEVLVNFYSYSHHWRCRARVHQQCTAFARVWWQLLLSLRGFQDMLLQSSPQLCEPISTFDRDGWNYW